MSTAVKPIEFSALEITQPIGTFYLGAIKSDDLVRISKVDMRRMENDDLDSYIGIQRELSQTRVKKIQQYVNNVDATFPSSIVLAVPEGCAHFDEDTHKMKLTPTDEFPLETLVTIIDGQHRVEGLKEFKGKCFEVNIALFVGIPRAVEANIFATVNLAQTKVNKSLVYDLYDYEKKRSPQKSAHHIAVGLDRTRKSPFEGRIKRLGTATKGRENEQLTQATVVTHMLPYLSPDPSKDRNTYLLGLVPNLYTEKESEKIIFGNLFLQKKDELIAEILFNYFSGVAKRWPNSWKDVGTKSNLLPKSTGYIALMGALRPIYRQLTANNPRNRIPTAADFHEILMKVKRLQDGKIDSEHFSLGASGSSEIKKRILKDIFGEELESKIHISK